MLARLGIPTLWGGDPDVLWRFMRYTVGPVTLTLAPARGYCAERVPLEGGAVLASNHLSAIDPPLVGALCPRPVYWMAKAELLALPLVGEILEWTGAFPVRRGAMIAVQEGVPLVPCGVYSFGWRLGSRMRCAAVWGEALDLSGLPRTGRGYREAAAATGGEILRLWRLAAEAVAARHPATLSDGSRAVPPGLVPFRRYRPPGARASLRAIRVPAQGKRREERTWRPARSAGTTTTRRSR